MDSDTRSHGADEFLILRRGEILGPFTRLEVNAALERGEISRDDFVQSGALAIWQPLPRWLDLENAARRGAIVQEWKSTGKRVFSRLRYDVLEGSVMVGAACAAIGTLVVILARWPALLWLPWFALAVLAGVLAMRNGRAVPGLLLLVAVAAVPVVFSLLTRERVTIGSDVETFAKEPSRPFTEPAPLTPSRPSATPLPAIVNVDE